MRCQLVAALSLLTLTTSLAAQEPGAARFRVGLAAAGGTLDYETDDSSLRGDTDAGLFRLEFEGTSRRGIGGGLRFEGIASDDDLFADIGLPSREARDSSLFLHFTYRLEEHRFAMPLRAGLRLGGLVLEDKTTGEEATFASVGPYFEIEPEVTLVHSERTNWSLYGELGFGAAATDIDIDNDPRDYSSTTAFFGLELGTRLLLGNFELGLAYVGRWQSMDESDVEQGFVVLGYDGDYQGVLFSLGVVF